MHREGAQGKVRHPLGVLKQFFFPSCLLKFHFIQKWQKMPQYSGPVSHQTSVCTNRSPYSADSSYKRTLNALWCVTLKQMLLTRFWDHDVFISQNLPLLGLYTLLMDDAPVIPKKKSGKSGLSVQQKWKLKNNQTLWGLSSLTQASYNCFFVLFCFYLVKFHFMVFQQHFLGSSKLIFSNITLTAVLCCAVVVNRFVTLDTEPLRHAQDTVKLFS